MSDAEKAAFANWLKADPLHAEQWKRTEALWADLGRLEPGPVVARRRRLAPFAWGAAAAVALVAAPLAWRESPATPVSAVTFVAAPVDADHRVELADGSIAIMRRGSRLAFGEFPQVRRVRLLAGEAHFTVSKSAATPFLVHAGPVVVRDIGTAFFVGLAREGVEVRVTEGQVELSAPVSPTRPEDAEPIRRTLVEGEQAIVRAAPSDDGAVTSRIAIPPAAAEADAGIGAWKSRRLRFDRTPLAEVVAQLNRYNVRQIRLTDSGTGELLISGTLQSDNLEAFVRLLEDAFDLRVQPEGARSFAVGSR